MAETEHELLERQRGFVRDASHELRTPITIALGHAELLRSSVTDPQAIRDADVVLDELGRLSRLSERMLLLASVEHELDTLFTNASGVEEALRSILFQGAIAAEDEAKREYVFLSLLRSQPALSAAACPAGRRAARPVPPRTSANP